MRSTCKNPRAGLEREEVEMYLHEIGYRKCNACGRYFREGYCVGQGEAYYHEFDEMLPVFGDYLSIFQLMFGEEALAEAAKEHGVELDKNTPVDMLWRISGKLEVTDDLYWTEWYNMTENQDEVFSGWKRLYSWIEDGEDGI